MSTTARRSAAPLRPPRTDPSGVRAGRVALRPVAVAAVLLAACAGLGIGAAQSQQVSGRTADGSPYAASAGWITTWSRSVALSDPVPAVAAGSRVLAVADDARAIAVYDPVTLRAAEEVVPRRAQDVTAVAADGAGTSVFAVAAPFSDGDPGTFAAYAATAGGRLRLKYRVQLPAGTKVASAAVSADGRTVYLANTGGRSLALASSDGAVRRRFPSTPLVVAAQDGSVYTTGAAGDLVQRRSASSLRVEAQARIVGDTVVAVAASGDDVLVASRGAVRQLHGARLREVGTTMDVPGYEPVLGFDGATAALLDARTGEAAIWNDRELVLLDVPHHLTLDSTALRPGAATLVRARDGGTLLAYAWSSIGRYDPLALTVPWQLALQGVPVLAGAAGVALLAGALAGRWNRRRRAAL